MVLSGYLLNSRDLTNVLRRAVDTILMGVPQLHSYVNSLFKEKHIVPSATTLYRHRLTIHLAFCRVHQDRNAEMQADPNGIVAWGTLDKSPNAGFDLLLCGHTTAKKSDVVELFVIANELSDDRLDDVTRTEHRLYLLQNLQMVPKTPAALGSGCSGLPYTVRAMSHATRLTEPNWKAVAVHLNSTLTWTGDLGEAKIVKYRGSLTKLFGSWIIDTDAGRNVQDRNLEDDDADDDVLEDHYRHANFDFQAPDHGGQSDDDDAESYVLDFGRSVFIAGLLHILHNFTSSLNALASLVHWPHFILQLKHVCRLIRRNWSRRRLLSQCFSADPFRLFRKLIESFDGEVYEGRWGTVMHAIGEVLKIEQPLREAWDKEAFLMGGQVKEGHGDGDGEGEGCKIDIVDFAIGSELFWSYLKMADHLAEIILKLMMWAEGCPCHTRVSPFFEGPTRHQRPWQEHRRQEHCAMEGRRASEMAAGDFNAFVRQLLDIVNGTLAISAWILILGPADRNKVMNDWAALRLHIRFTLDIKLAFWRQLPWILFGLAHANSDQAIACGKRALALAQWQGAMGQHWLVLQLCFAFVRSVVRFL